VREVAGVRVGILGLTTPNVASWEPARNIEGLRFRDTVEAARRYVGELRGRERCDLVVVIAHQGFERDLDTGEDRGTSDENQAYALAQGVAGIDVLLTGHTHTVIEPRKLGAVWVSQPGRFGNTVTRFDLKLERRGRRWTLTSVSGKNLPMKEVPPDPEVVRAVEKGHEAAMRALAAPIAELASPLSVSTARVADTAILDWLHAVQRSAGKADLSVASLLPGTLPEWPPGPLTLRQIWAFYPYENSLVTVRVTGRQLREALERSARCVSGIREQDGKLVWARNRSVWGYNCDTLDGAEYGLDPLRPEGKRVLFLRREGREIQDQEELTVAVNSYRAAGGGGFSVWRKAPRVAESGRSIRELLVEDARRRGTLKLESNANWFLAPSLPEGWP
jgi:2',3'-cyclic-nucleotide 2'-phosphodiesterase/3'-nucleotidase